MIECDTIQVSSEGGIIATREKAREIAKFIGFGVMDLTRIVTAVSELVRNAFQYAGGGNVTIKIVRDLNRKGIEVIVDDQGPGISNLELVLKGGYSTGKGLGLGLSGAKRLMDEFVIETHQNKGTKIIIRKWL
ncbi:MAG TPA: anti-sigma regulatory factor [Candidatus Lokiarchaeia archaeon]|nr:anti-sigma regulatory factor [Candidatus Lokiarchaeia archaeon]